MRSYVLLSLLLVACNKGDDTEVATDPDLDDGFEHYDFTSGMLAACSGNISWQKWTYNEGPAEATVVFANGRTEYTDKYHHLLPMLSEQPWNVVMFDHMGQGRSDGARAHATDWDAEFTCDTDMVIAAQADPNLPLAIMAHSTGSFITARWAQLNPGIADVMVLGSPLFMHDTTPYSENDARALCSTKVAIGDGEDLHEPPTPRVACDDPTQIVTHDCAQYALFKDDPITVIGGPTYSWLQESFEAFDAFQADLGSFTPPVLMLQAGDEQVVLESAIVETCDALNEVHPGQCERVEFPGDYHELYNELDRADVMARGIAFIEGKI